MKMYKTTIFPEVLYERETWSLTLRDEHTDNVWEQGADEKGVKS
jgi:hypothetical protein